MNRLSPVAVLMLGACLGSGSDDVTEPIDAPMPIDAPIIDAPPGGNAGFITPTSITKANEHTGGSWAEVGDADWSCHGTATTDQPSTGTLTLSGRIDDFQTGNGVGAATITAWSTSPSVVVGSAASSNVAGTRGEYTMTLGMLPAGTSRYGFTLSADQHVTTHIVGAYYPPGAPATDIHELVSEATAVALPAFIGVTRDVTKGLYVGSLRDCQGRFVSNAVAGISTDAGVFTNAGGTTFYFSAGSSSLPVRHNVAPVMNLDGRYMVINAEPRPDVFVQIWGFRTAAELAGGTMTLLAQIRAGVDAGTAVVADLEALRD